MNLDVHFMASLIGYYMIIQLLEMERRYTYVKYVVFQSQFYLKAFFSKHPFCILLFFIKTLDYIYKNKNGVFNTCEIIDLQVY
jgi:hypothetical protein